MTHQNLVVVSRRRMALLSLVLRLVRHLAEGFLWTFNEQGLLVISVCDGIGALRVALESLKVPLVGYVAIEKDERASRVVESNFPSCTFCPDVKKASSADIRSWGAKYPNCCAVLVLAKVSLAWVLQRKGQLLLTVSRRRCANFWLGVPPFSWWKV